MALIYRLARIDANRLRVSYPACRSVARALSRAVGRSARTPAPLQIAGRRPNRTVSPSSLTSRAVEDALICHQAGGYADAPILWLDPARRWDILSHTFSLACGSSSVHFETKWISIRNGFANCHNGLLRITSCNHANARDLRSIFRTHRGCDYITRRIDYEVGRLRLQRMSGLHLEIAVAIRVAVALTSTTDFCDTKNGGIPSTGRLSRNS